ncbi:MAG TPA: hypothetical protein VFP95_04190 [Gammaproteobacteria bacterium]|nr:hypothetical protein [Gammaproteobacteria bacterium]
MRTALKWIAANSWNAIVVTAALGLLPLLQVFSGGVVALKTLRQGLMQGLAVASSAALIVGVLAWLTGQSPISMGIAVLMLWLPVLGLAELLRRSASLALVIQVATLLGFFGVGLFLLQTPDPVVFWQNVLETEFEPLLSELARTGRAVDTAQLQAMARLATGMVAACMVLLTAIALLLGRWAQSVLDKPGGFGQAFRAWRNGRIATVIASIIFIASLLTGNIYLQNMALVLLPMLLLQGLAIAHFAVYHLKMQRLWLIGLYIFLLLVPLHAVALVVVVGFLEEFFGFRAMLARLEIKR